MTGGRDDRRWALALGGLGVAAGLGAVGFQVAFVTDPLGPRAFPWLAAALLVGAAAGLALRPGPDADWPARSSRRRLAWVTAALLAWSVVLPVAGFVIATTLLLAGLGRLFGAAWRPGLVAGLAVAVALHLLFGWGLGLPLPAGPWG